jgi:hypothetical protein
MYKTPKDIYRLIHSIYNKFDFKEKGIINNLMIIPSGNLILPESPQYYLCQYEDESILIKFRVEIYWNSLTSIDYDFTIDKEFKLKEYDKKNPFGHYIATRYPIISIDTSQEIPDGLIKELIPILRQFQIEILLLEDGNK